MEMVPTHEAMYLLFGKQHYSHKQFVNFSDWWELMSFAGLDYKLQVGIGHFYHIFYEGCLTNFEIGEDGEEASKLYPEVNYTRMDEYLKIYV